MKNRNSVHVALLADTHGELDARIAEEVGRCDCVVHAGDIGAASVLRSLAPRSGVVIAVRGNNDVAEKWPSADRLLLQSLPDEATLPLPGGDLVVSHGHRAGAPAIRHAVLRERFPAARAVVYGHSHRRVVDRARLPWIIDPGAAGKPRPYGGPSLVNVEATITGWRAEEIKFDKV